MVRSTLLPHNKLLGFLGGGFLRGGGVLLGKADVLEAEGSWDEVMRIIGQAHGLLHGQGVVRIQTDIRVGTRTDKRQGFGEKVKVVEELLARDAEG